MTKTAPAAQASRGPCGPGVVSTCVVALGFCLTLGCVLALQNGSQRYLRPLKVLEEAGSPAGNPTRIAPPDEIICGSPVNTVQAAANLVNAKPLIWVHFPKCGTSFFNVLMHHPGVCPYYPSDALLLSGDMHAHIKSLGVRIFGDNSLLRLCPGGLSREYIGPPFHDGAGKALVGKNQHGVAFFRQPEQRIISGFHHDFHDYPKGRIRSHGEPDLPEYAMWVQGCMVKILTEEGQNPCLTGRPPKSSQVGTAVVRAKKFAFVGLTEEWFLSVCAFHVMLGGSCCNFEFMNVRKGALHRGTAASHFDAYNESGLKGFIDVFDGPLYAAVEKRFRADLQMYKITLDSCLKLCEVNDD